MVFWNTVIHSLRNVNEFYHSGTYFGKVIKFVAGHHGNHTANKLKLRFRFYCGSKAYKNITILLLYIPKLNNEYKYSVSILIYNFFFVVNWFGNQ